MRDWLCSHYYVPCAVLILLGFAGFLLYLARRVRMKDMIMITVLSAIIAISRGVFFWIPQFKPVSALVLITGSCFGSVPGMLVGMLSGFLSNFMFSQGPWTPFQMLAWGLIGFSAGVLAGPIRKSRAALCVFGAAAGVMFSLLMDIWTVLWADGTFNLARYAAAVVSALPVTAEYAVSNVIFLLILANPIGEKLERMKKKYGLFVSA